MYIASQRRAFEARVEYRSTDIAIAVSVCQLRERREMITAMGLTSRVRPAVPLWHCRTCLSRHRHRVSASWSRVLFDRVSRELEMPGGLGFLDLPMRVVADDSEDDDARSKFGQGRDACAIRQELLLKLFLFVAAGGGFASPHRLR